jgi:hypothetical protein
LMEQLLAAAMTSAAPVVTVVTTVIVAVATLVGQLLKSRWLPGGVRLLLTGPLRAAPCGQGGLETCGTHLQQILDDSAVGRKTKSPLLLYSNRFVKVVLPLGITEVMVTQRPSGESRPRKCPS